ncbi:MAG: TerB family tellurite resistance protein [Cyclobacteriaceae bacterium]|nr:TerB family tellurite resistance protein [Cyclobacteriaceae bacterium]
MAALQQIQLLVNLARIDGAMDEQEKAYIVNIGVANGFPASSVETLFYASEEVQLGDALTDQERFNYLFSLVQLMKIDGRLYKNEIRYCADMAARLGYDKEVMFELMSKVHGIDMDKGEVDALRDLTHRYLKGH